ncbi:helix-turn-helix domain-containing protein [Metabacillus halosaccharovorans]|uniref:Helix-turn-helix domain-containing protein n=1 Tax=Metabacillus halosaccharovorans TaxID=930124 RepID=A0ABT3DCM7_9BACI|nr:helix-turn-helix transcriptional regulator [Metabacillus halosaccharovorans]MCV9884717.1 helix-turn-helix domain-containing protein [Metabacillus halosaccharovorans]
MESWVTSGSETIYYPDVKVFGSKLKQLRLSKKLSLKDVSRKIGWWHWCIEDWENGEPVSFDTLKTLAEFYHVSTDYLLSKDRSEYQQLTLF